MCLLLQAGRSRNFKTAMNQQQWQQSAIAIGFINKIIYQRQDDMMTIDSSILTNVQFVQLSDLTPEGVAKEIRAFITPDEEILQAFKTIRDQVIFTNKRILVMNVQGLTGTRVSYFSYPYSKVQYFGIQKAGIMDINSELVLVFANNMIAQFDFIVPVDIKKICSTISRYTL